MKIKIPRELDLEQNLAFRALLSNRVQKVILMPFVKKFRIIHVVYYLMLIYPTESSKTNSPESWGFEISSFWSIRSMLVPQYRSRNGLSIIKW